METEKKKTIADFSPEELKYFVRDVIREEAQGSHIPLLGIPRRKKLKKVIWWIIALSFLVFIGYHKCHKTTNVRIIYSGEQLYTYQIKEGFAEQRKIFLENDEWKLQTVGSERSEPIFTPYEADFYKSRLVFLRNGGAFLIESDRTNIRPIRYKGTHWEYYMDGEWISFEALFEAAYESSID